MASYKRLDLQQLCMVVAKVMEGNSYWDVANSMGINWKTVGAIMQKHKRNYFLADLPRAGRPHKTTSSEDRFLVRMSLGDRRLIATDIKQRLEQHGVQLTTRNVRERLQKAGFRGCVAARLLFISLLTV